MGFGIDETPVQGGPHIVVLYLYALQPLGLVGALQFRCSLLHQRQKVIPMSTPNRPLRPTFQKPLAGILPHGLQQPVAGAVRSGLRGHQRLAGQPVSDLQRGCHVTAGAHLGRLCEPETSGEHGQLAKHAAFFGQQQFAAAAPAPLASSARPAQSHGRA